MGNKEERRLGPNARELLSLIIAREAIPPGGGLADGLKFFTNDDHRKRVIATAIANLDTIFELIKTAPDNPYGDDEEAIAAGVLKRFEREN